MKSSFVLFIFLSVISAAFSSDDEQISTRREDFATKIKVFIYNKEIQKEYELLNFKDILTDVNFDISKPTMIYMHGFLESTQTLSVRTVIEAYLQRGDHNVIAVDWFAYSTGSYHLKVLPQLHSVAENIAKYLTEFIVRGYSPKKIHLVGHSMGGQAVGLIGRTVADLLGGSSKRISRITGLDPAGVGFEPVLPLVSFSPLSQGDGDFVDIIHTDGGGYGYRKACGDIDFYPNEGKRYQPGCHRLPLIPDENQSGPFGFCSHWMSWRFFALTVNSPTMYEAVKCDSWRKFVKGKCDRAERMFMGYGTLATATGSYYLHATLPSQ